MIFEKSLSSWIFLNGERLHQKLQHTQNCVSELAFLSALNLHSYGLCGFNKYEHLRKYRRQEFENVLEKMLCNCFRQLLRIYSKNIEHGIE